ncbi:Protoporphyrinogen oxidase [Holothuria leucospilota]|uniref:Protoporphyrinogen oxidase n=1 Tax=Holothuria leucospilota TaxID=206669 RepID=A0A9Q0Y8Q1_HOLLE|nr:Protoporphyrinogen oxidase [Holothuria leucospilota]
MQRTVRCQLGLLVVDDSFCEAMTKPIDEQTCMSLNCSPVLLCLQIVLLEANTRLGGWIHSNHTQHGSVHELGTRSIRPAGLVGKNTLDMGRYFA